MFIKEKFRDTKAIIRSRNFKTDNAMAKEKPIKDRRNATQKTNYFPHFIQLKLALTKHHAFFL